jgi:hypothetical protein
MPKSNKDALADALAGMSDGENSTPSKGIEAGGTSSAPVSASDADDAVIAPPPDASVFAAKVRTVDLVAQQKLHAQRTAIPILLTCGVLLPAVGALKWLAPRTSVFAAWDVVLPIGLFVVGAMLLILAVLNMLHVRDTLRRLKRRAGPSPGR